ncbi:TrmH family RNA methyltransferase [Desulfomicrobium orale]|uniref:TrmH family RNA methyltransferase n=1 Tax=Desulfomicrobium orale TaxID=132132 RepID=UPI000A8FF648|nr:RNA methyltransferase [Desulfomicrobium orale]
MEILPKPSRKRENQADTHLTPGRKPVLECIMDRPHMLDTVFLAEDAPGLGEVIQACRQHGVRFRKIPRRELDRMFQGAHQGVVARLRGREFMEIEPFLAQAARSPLPLVLALDQVQDPGNAGTLARTLLALGGGGLLFPRDRSAFLGQAAAKAAAGALDRLPLCQVVNLSRTLDTCRDSGFSVYGTGLDPQTRPLFGTAFSFPAVLVLGNEDKGMRPNVGKRCQAVLSIPMHAGWDSLNVAQAGAMIMGEMLRQHGGGVWPSQG